MTETLDTAWQISDDVRYNQVGDEIVILDLVGGSYFGLDSIGSQVWHGFEASISPRTICENISQQYGIEMEVVEEDVLKLLESLIAQDLIINPRECN